MKKEMIICFFVIAFVIILNFVTEKHTDSVINDIEREISDLRLDLISKEDLETTDKIDDAIKHWEQEKELLSIYTEHNEIEKIGVYLNEVKSNIETKEYSIAIQSLDSCIFEMNYIKDKYKLKLTNIF